ncbi:hypothetical protein D3C73_1262140 [compost metagenome]
MMLLTLSGRSSKFILWILLFLSSSMKLGKYCLELSCLWRLSMDFVCCVGFNLNACPVVMDLYRCEFVAKGAFIECPIFLCWSSTS